VVGSADVIHPEAKMSTFQAAVVRTPRGPDSIEIIDVPVVEPGPGQVRVEIAGAAVNPVDLALAAGVFHELGLVHQPDHTGLGWDFAGVVIATGPDVELPVGSRVAGLVDGFDRDFGTYAEQIVVPASDTALVPDGLDLTTAAAVPLNSLAAAQLVDMLGDGRGRRLLVTGAAGALGGNVVRLAQDRGWRVTGLARGTDEMFVRGLGAEFTTDAAPGWDSVADCAALQERGLALVRDGGLFVGVQPGAAPQEERGIAVHVVVAHPDGTRLARLLDATASGHLPARVHAVVPLGRAATAHRAVTEGGVRGKYVLQASRRSAPATPRGRAGPTARGLDDGGTSGAGTNVPEHRNRLSGRGR
jgi:NADPH:quinone reductase-like Zn-dependent oxidoreductase